MNMKDRRSVGGAKTTGTFGSPIALSPDLGEGPTARDVRRALPGTRTADGFFASDKLQRPMTRQDYLNLRASEEYHRRERALWRRAWRWLTHRPSTVDMIGRMADAHGRTLAAIEQRVTQLRAEREEKERAAKTAAEAPHA